MCHLVSRSVMHWLPTSNSLTFSSLLLPTALILQGAHRHWSLPETCIHSVKDECDDCTKMAACIWWILPSMMINPYLSALLTLLPHEAKVRPLPSKAPVQPKGAKANYRIAIVMKSENHHAILRHSAQPNKSQIRSTCLLTVLGHQHAGCLDGLDTGIWLRQVYCSASVPELAGVRQR